MLRNRTLQLSFVSPDKKPPIPGSPTVDTTVDVERLIKVAALGAAGVIGTYFMADTLRQVTVYTVATKIK